MASTMTRRPLPALISLLALIVLAAIVWWRVADRASSDTAHASGAHPAPTSCPTARTPTPTSTGAARTPARTSTGTSTGTSTPAAPITVAPASVSVRVLNSTDRTGLGGKVRTALVADGFRSPDAAGNDSPMVSISGPAEIRYGSGSAAAKQGARLLAYYLPGSTVRAIGGTSATVTVSVGDGYKSLASPAAVKAALAAAARPSGAPATGSTASTPTSC